ncbi:metallophosphoesterase 1 homolog isoform X2 [Mercenaria mercenaria]|uniref:metallophosphoesterase 1 homolog isoform X2 n=1 Tax=Mercenaria mercenaria TaxID=6596 RepID=UPI00234F2603|nr:metallophosphoesterase 1 homolog isoform X2 [Mercenaria mercenaria]
MKYNGYSYWDPTWLKIFLSWLAVAFFINEYLVYYIQSYRWPTFPNIPRNSERYQVLLLVGDPQIQGYQDERIFPAGTIARWDIDRYLRKTFSYAYEYSQPDVIVFLGDLFDEGSKASKFEYSETLDRFTHIYHETKHTKTIYIPGDNDIGGEGRDFMTTRKVERFERNFGNMSEIIKFGFIDYVKLHILTHALTEEKVAAAERLRHKQTSKYTLLLNHQTFMMGPKHFVYPIIKRLQPKLILSAHWHKSELFTCDDCLRDDEYSWTVSRQDMSFIKTFLNIDMSGEHSMFELAVPTCSYRMGMVNIGFTVAILGEDGSLQFAVLWLPRRYTMLLGYLVALIVYIIAYCMNRCGSRRR